MEELRDGGGRHMKKEVVFQITGITCMKCVRWVHFHNLKIFSLKFFENNRTWSTGEGRDCNWLMETPVNRSVAGGNGEEK